MAITAHTKTEQQRLTRSTDCLVGLLDVCEVRDAKFAGHLSVNERAKYLSLPGQRRRDEWLAGRLAAKCLFLNWLDMSEKTRSTTWNSCWQPTLEKFSAASLGVYSPWMYQKVEVLSDGGQPRFVWCGKERTESVSVSHAGGVACAAIATGERTAVDLETAVPRNEAFYRKTFTEAERYWVANVAGGDLRNSNWCYTLLWTLKESALKLGWLDEASLWNLPRIEIEGLPGFKHVEPFWCGNAMRDAFVVFTARIKEARRAMPVQVGVAGTRNFVLTVMNPLIGAVN